MKRRFYSCISFLLTFVFLLSSFLFWSSVTENKVNAANTLTTSYVKARIDELVESGRIGKSADNMAWAKENFSDRLNCNGFVRYLCKLFYGYNDIGQQQSIGTSKCLLVNNDSNFEQVGRTLCNVSESSYNKVSLDSLKDLFMRRA